METLLIEGNPKDAQVLQNVFRDPDHVWDDIVHVRSLKDAFEEIKRKHFDVAVVNLNLPDSRGIKTIKKLMAEAPLLAVIVLIEPRDQLLGIKAVHLGVQNYLIKGNLDGPILFRSMQYAIERKKNNDQLKKSKDQLETEKFRLEEVMSMIEKDLNSSIHQDLDRLIDIVIKKIAEVLSAEKCSLMFFDQDTGRLCIRGQIGIDEEFIGKNNPQDDNAIGKIVVKERAPFLVRDIEKSPHFLRPNRPTYKSKSFMSAPLILRSGILGVINVADKNAVDGDMFNEVDFKTFLMIARNVAVAIENAKVYKELKYLVITDPLTSVYNFRHFCKVLDYEIERAVRLKEPLCLLFIDVDDFKSYNDAYGHQAGDNLLKSITKVLRESLRKIDIVCRYAGDEFVVILPRTDIFQAEVVAKKIISKGMDLPLERKITLSIGIGQWGQGMDRQDLVRRSDGALFEAKRQGKNTVCTWGKKPEEVKAIKDQEENDDLENNIEYSIQDENDNYMIDLQTAKLMQNYRKLGEAV